MQIQLEHLPYQEQAIKSVIDIFRGQERNTFDNACFEGIRANICRLTSIQITENIKSVLAENAISEETGKISADRDLCIEMETGTGKTLVYIKTIYELYKTYGFTKFIILVPSVAIRQGTLSTLQTFQKQLEDIYGFKPNYFEYDSKKLNKVTNFIEEQHPQIMIMTLASFNSEDKILNQAQREDLFANIPYIEALGKTNPIVIMDEPQEGMDTENSVAQIAKLNPLFKIRYSATHKVVKNLLYRLTPYDSYKDGLVKKIEVLTVTEKNDEATLKIELSNIQVGDGSPKAKLKAWRLKGGKFVFEETVWLKENDNLGEKTNNPSYNQYTIKRIYKSLRDGKFKIEFSNGIELLEKQRAGNVQAIWSLQLEWLIKRHFQKTQKLQPYGIKCLSLIFIDKVANYIGENPIIKNLFVEKYKQVYKEFNETEPTKEHIENIQGYYFAQTGKGEFTDSESSMRSNKEIYELILKRKEELLSVSNSIQFIFSHSALGVGWDNPNVFNIATLNQSYSDIKKRQEIGRGLRISVNQEGHRVYDAKGVDDENRINFLTVVPNETYETYVEQYQTQIREVYGTTDAGAAMAHTHKGVEKDKQTFKRNNSTAINEAFKRFWNALARKTDYTIAFNEESVITNATDLINRIAIPEYLAEVSSRTIDQIREQDVKYNFGGSETYRLKGVYAPIDLIEEISENTGLSYSTTLRIVNGITNIDQMIKNPPLYLQEAMKIIKNEELAAMIRGLTYHVTSETFPFSFDDFVQNVDKNRVVPTPKRGVFEKMIVDSGIEKSFAAAADSDDEVVCFLKLPAYYKIPTPIGNYEPDFGLVMKRKSLATKDENEFYFVVETKGTNDINDKKVLTDNEYYNIQCAMKHFAALGVEVKYEAPVKEYSYFKSKFTEKTT